MTRTPLLSRLQRLCRDYDIQEATGRPLAEIQASRLSASPSRREFLTRFMLMGGAAACPVAARRKNVCDG